MIDCRKYLIGKEAYDLTDKKKTISDKIEYMLIKCQQIFKWENLPDTIPQRNLELMLQVNGSVIFMEHEGDLCVYNGGLGGEPDYLYRPTIATIANPAQRFDAQVKIQWDIDGEGDCVVILNDVLAKGLLDIHRNFATQMSENELSIWLADILTRMPWLLSAQDEKTKKSAEEFLKNIFDAKLGVVTDSAFLDGIKEHVLTSGSANTMNQLIILNQYLKSCWYNEIGLNAMQNGMKKEAISDSEEQMNQDILRPLIDEMLYERQKAVEIINKKYGTDIKVDLASSWKDNVLEEELALQEVEEPQEEKEAEGIEETSEDVEDNEIEEAEETTTEENEETELEEIVEELEEIVEEIKEGSENEQSDTPDDQ